MNKVEFTSSDASSLLPDDLKPALVLPSSMTTKVVKGSLWNLAGQVSPALVSFITTPIIVRLLGAERYGVLILVLLTPSYLGFADFGMGMGSTKFSSEAYAAGNHQKEASIVRLAALVGFISSLLFVVPLVVFSYPIIVWLKVPESLQYQASVGLKLAALTVVFLVLANTINSPQLARLRIDLNTLINALPKIMIPFGTLLVLGSIGRIDVAVGVTLAAGIITFVGHLYFSARLLPELFGTSLDRENLKPLLRFGCGWLFASVAGVLLVNIEKLALTRLVSVRSLAYYSISFTLATVASMSGAAMMQILVPALSQLRSPEKAREFDELFSRTTRLNLILIPPILMLAAVAARPFFAVWAGEEFSRESSVPLYILLVVLFFNMVAYSPHSALTRAGRTGAVAKLYWVELTLYLVVVFLLIGYFGITGAAVAWTLRVTADAIAVVWLSRRFAGVNFDFAGFVGKVLLRATVLAPPLLFAALLGNFSLWLLLLAPLSAASYCFLIWKTLTEPEEREWVESRLTAVFS